MLTITKTGLIKNHSKNFYRLIGRDLHQLSTEAFIALVLEKQYDIPNSMVNLLPFQKKNNQWTIKPSGAIGVLIGSTDVDVINNEYTARKPVRLFAVEMSAPGHFYGSTSNPLTDAMFLSIALGNYWGLNSIRILKSSPLLDGYVIKHNNTALNSAWYLEEKTC